MGNINLPPFYVGQRVVAIKDSGPIPTMISYNKGDEFIVSITKQSRTKKEWHCGFTTRPPDEYYDCNSFVPVEQNFQSITIEKVLELEMPLISVN